MAFVVGPCRSPVIRALLQLEAQSAKHPRSVCDSAQVRKLAPRLAHPKDDLVVSEPYRRLVAALPCIHCGISGYSQAAHIVTEGKGIKRSDLDTFPLCCTRSGEIGCHVKYDTYKLFTREKAVAQGKRWAASTRRSIAKAGNWPKRLAAHMPKLGRTAK